MYHVRKTRDILKCQGQMRHFWHTAHETPWGAFVGCLWRILNRGRRFDRTLSERNTQGRRGHKGHSILTGRLQWNSKAKAVWWTDFGCWIPNCTNSKAWVHNEIGPKRESSVLGTTSICFQRWAPQKNLDLRFVSRSETWAETELQLTWTPMAVCVLTKNSSCPSSSALSQTLSWLTRRFYLVWRVRPRAKLEWTSLSVVRKVLHVQPAQHRGLHLRDVRHFSIMSHNCQVIFGRLHLLCSTASVPTRQFNGMFISHSREVIVSLRLTQLPIHPPPVLSNWPSPCWSSRRTLINTYLFHRVISGFHILSTGRFIVLMSSFSEGSHVNKGSYQVWKFRNWSDLQLTKMENNIHFVNEEMKTQTTWNSQRWAWRICDPWSCAQKDTKKMNLELLTSLQQRQISELCTKHNKPLKIIHNRETLTIPSKDKISAWNWTTIVWLGSRAGRICGT